MIASSGRATRPCSPGHGGGAPAAGSSSLYKLNILRHPQPGEVLAWQGQCMFMLETIKSVCHARNAPGVLNPRRELAPLLDSEDASVLPGSVIRLDGLCGHVHWDIYPIYFASVGDHSIVLKLYCKDMREPGENVDMKNFNYMQNEDLIGDAVREARAYKALEAAQGSLVPFCYGFCQFTLSNGITCVGQVLEYIEGVPAMDCLKPQHPAGEQTVYTFLTALYMALIEFHKQGVLHRDEADRNILLLSASGQSLAQIVIFDFNLCQVLDMGPPPPASVPDKWLRMDEICMELLLKELSIVDHHERWKETSTGQALIERWHKYPPLLSESECIPLWYIDRRAIKARL